jgi:hypothetical protein
MVTRTTFTILTRGAGFFAHGGHEESDDEITLGGKVEEESYSDSEFGKPKEFSSLNLGDSFDDLFGGMPLYIDIQGPIDDMGMSGLNIPGEVTNPGLRGDLDALFEQPYEGGFDDIFEPSDVFEPSNLFDGDDDNDYTRYAGHITEEIDGL